MIKKDKLHVIWYKNFKILEEHKIIYILWWRTKQYTEKEKKVCLEEVQKINNQIFSIFSKVHWKKEFDVLDKFDITLKGLSSLIKTKLGKLHYSLQQQINSIFSMRLSTCYCQIISLNINYILCIHFTEKQLKLIIFLVYFNYLSLNCIS